MKKGALLAAFIYSIFHSGCSGPSLISSWQNNEIKIDGSRQEWEEDLKYLDDEEMALSVKNDDEFLYLCLATVEQAKIVRIMQTGFTVWLDPQSSDGKTIGIQYPIKLGRDPKADRPMRDLQNEEEGEGNIEKMIERFQERQNEILILNENNFPLNALPAKNSGGIEAAFGFDLRQFVYELRVPLANNTETAVFIDALPNEDIKVTFETGKIERPERSGMGRNPAIGGMQGGRRGGMRGGQGRMRNMPGMPELIEFSVDVKLALKK